MVLRRLIPLFLCVLSCLYSACGEVPATNPFDPATPADQRAAGLLRGRLLAPEGYDLAQLAELRVSLHAVAADADAGDEALSRTPAVDGDERGRFVFEDLRAGTYLLRVDATPLTMEPLPVVVAVGAALDLGDLALRAQSAAEAMGTVAGVARRAGAADTGHGGITVRLNGTPIFGVTAPDGAFLLQAPAGLYDVTAEAPGYALATHPDLRLAPGANPPLDAPLLLTAEAGAVRVAVHLPAGFDDPARLARVVVTLAPRPAAEAPAPPAPRDATPTAAGVARFDDVLPGAYLLSAALDDTAFTGDSVPVEVGPGALVLPRDLQIGLAALAPGERPAQISGHALLEGVLDGATEAGHAGIVVSVLTTPLTAVTGADGGFFLTGVPTGAPLTLRFSKPGFAALSLDVPALAREESRSLEPVQLAARPGEVRGRVALDRYGSAAALADAVVALLDADDRPVGAAERLPDGGFRLADVPAGTFTLTAGLAGYDTARREVTVVVGGVTEVGEVVLRHESGTESGVALRGRVRLEGEAEHTGTLVRLTIAGRDVPFEQTVTDAAGVFEVRASPHEQYRVTAEHGGFGLPAGLGPYHLDAASDAFVDDRGAGIDLEMTQDPLNGRLTVQFDVAPQWVAPLVTEAHVQVVGPTALLDATAHAGEPAVFGDLPAGAYLVRVTRPGFLPLEDLVLLQRGHADASVEGALLLTDLAAAALPLSHRTLTAADLAGVSLRGADLSGVVLSGGFPGADLTGARLSGADLAGADLTGAHLQFATLVSANLAGATLIDADLSAANLTNADLQSARFTDTATLDAAPPTQPCVGDAARVHETAGLRADLRGTVLASADLGDATLAGLDLRATQFAGALLVGTQLPLACLRGVRLALTDLSGANLDRADARGIVLANSVLLGTTLRGADLTTANLLSTVLERTDFGCVETAGAGDARRCACAEPMDLVPPVVTPVVDPHGPDVCPDLRVPDLRDVVPAGPRDGHALGCRTRLAHASLNGANMVGVDFTGADLTAAGLSGVAIGDALCPDAAAPGCAGGAAGVPTRLVETRLDQVNLAGIGWNHADLRGATFRNADLSNAVFSPNARYDEVVLTGANLTGATLVDLDLRTVDLQRTNLRLADLSRSDARGVPFNCATLDATVLTGARLRTATFEHTRLTGTVHFEDMAEEVHNGLDFRGAELLGGDLGWLQAFEGVNLDDAWIGHCDPARAPFSTTPVSLLEGQDLDVAPAESVLRWRGHTLRGLRAPRCAPGDLATEHPVDLEALAGINVLGFPRTPILERSDLGRANVSARRLELTDSAAAGATIEIRSTHDRPGDLRALRSDLTGARLRLGEGAFALEDAPSVTLQLCDLTQASLYGQGISGRVERCLLDATDFAPRVTDDVGDRVASWAGAEFRLLDFSTSTPPKILQPGLGADAGKLPLMVDVDFSAPGDARRELDVSNWFGVRVVHGDLRACDLVVRSPLTRLGGQFAGLPRHFMLRSSRVDGASLKRLPGPDPGPTAVHLVQTDVTNLRRADVVLSADDVVTTWRDIGLAANHFAPATQRGVRGGTLLVSYVPFVDPQRPTPEELTQANLLRDGLLGLDPAAYKDESAASPYEMLIAAQCAVAPRSPACPPFDAGFTIGRGANLTGASFGATELTVNWPVGADRAQPWDGLNLTAARLAGTNVTTINAIYPGAFMLAADTPEAAPTFVDADLAGATLQANLGTLARADFTGARLPTFVASSPFCVACLARGLQAGVNDADLQQFVTNAFATLFTGDVPGTSPLVLPQGSAWLRAGLQNRALSASKDGFRTGLPAVIPAGGLGFDLFAGAWLGMLATLGVQEDAPVALWRADLTGAQLGRDDRPLVITDLLLGGVDASHALIGADTAEALTLNGVVVGRAGFDAAEFAHLSIQESFSWDAFSAPGATFAGATVQPFVALPAGEAGTPGLSLRRANLGGLRVTEANDFGGADLMCADLRGLTVVGNAGPQNFDHANLAFADLRGADLRTASFRDANLRYARIDAATRLPAPDAFEGAALAYSGIAARLGGAQPDVDGADRADRVPRPDCAQAD